MQITTTSHFSDQLMKISNLKIELSEEELEEINDLIDEEKLKIDDAKDKIEYVLKTDFKNIPKVYELISIVEKSKEELKSLNQKKIENNSYTGNYNQNLLSQGLLNPGWGTTNIGWGSTITNGGGNSFWNNSVYKPRTTIETDNVMIEMIDSDLEKEFILVHDDLFKSEFGNYYLRKTDGAILYLKRVISIDEKLNNDEEKDSKLHIWFENKNKNFLREQKLKNILDDDE